MPNPKLILTILSSLLIGSIILAWQGPTQPPPQGNVPLPINVSSTPQGKLGSLGIGISQPISRLHIKDGQSWGSDLSIDATGLPGGRRWLLISTAGTASEGQGKFLIKDNNAGLVRLTIDPSGNVGIGTTSPTAKLEVAGDIKTTSNFIVKDSSNNFDQLFSSGIIKEKFLPY